MKPILTTIFVLVASVLFAQQDPLYSVERMNHVNPIISQAMFTDCGAEVEGHNINGPSVIRIPDWITPEHRAHPEAKYYMYFAHHKGAYIRMAWSRSIEGPWSLYQTGKGASIGDRGVLDHGNKYIELDNGIRIQDNHLASPHVIVDDEHQRIVMYFHTGSSTYVKGERFKLQYAYVSTAPYGLEFYEGIEPVVLGRFYFHVFEYDKELYAFSNSGWPFKAPSLDAPWTTPQDFDYTQFLWQAHPNSPATKNYTTPDGNAKRFSLRHSSVRLVGDELHVFYSQKGLKPERVQMSTIDMSVGDWEKWVLSDPQEIMEAQPGWEGGHLPKLPSSGGWAPDEVNQLRDPFVFEDKDGELYLFYTGSGENAIGVARLHYNE